MLKFVFGGKGKIEYMLIPKHPKIKAILMPKQNHPSNRKKVKGDVEGNIFMPKFGFDGKKTDGYESTQNCLVLLVNISFVKQGR